MGLTAKVLVPLLLLLALAPTNADETSRLYEWSNEAADLSCFVSGDRASIRATGDDGYNVTNATFPTEGRMFVNLLLDKQDAQFELPGLLLRVSTARYVDEDFGDPFSNIEDLKQGIWSTVGGNLLGMLFCVVGSGIIIFLEKHFKCVGGAKIHEMVEQQHKLQGDLNQAVRFLKDHDADPSMGEELAAKKMAEKGVAIDKETGLPVVDEDAAKKHAQSKRGKVAAEKAVDGALASTFGGAKAGAVKKAAGAIAEMDEFAEAKNKAELAVADATSLHTQSPRQLAFQG